MSTFIKLENISISYARQGVDSNNLKRHLLKYLTLNQYKPVQEDLISVSALKDISLNIYEGERVGLIGINGSGKTTLLKVLAHILYPTRGEMTIHGKINSIFDPSLGMDPFASGVENIKIRCMLLGIKDEDIPEKTVEIIKFSDLGNAVYRPLKTYSAGMAMRLAFSIATCIKPEILVMDEWLSAGDAKFVSKALDKMRTLIDHSRILVLASHSEDILTKWCNRVIWLENGLIIKDGAPASVLQEYNNYIAKT